MAYLEKGASLFYQRKRDNCLAYSQKMLVVGINFKALKTLNFHVPELNRCNSTVRF